MLRVSGLAARYGAITALRDVSLDVERGRTVALIGSNGAGKSTLLNSLVGAVRPAAGEIVFDGVRLDGSRTHEIARRGVLLVPEGRQVLAPLTVENNLELGRVALRDRHGEYDLAAVYRLFPRLHERKRQAAGSLSGGEQQMLAIGRALMGGPRILLLDEPSLGLSPLLATQVFDALRTLNEAGLTILLVEQNARRALRLASTAYVLERGRIVAHGPSDALQRDPEIVAHYLGSA